MTMTDWAENEVRIACDRERGDNDPNEWDYGCACYESALKAYKCLAEDDHSGMSWNITKNILTSLMNGNPLTPIEDVPEVWNECAYQEKGEIVAQCNRRSSLFKTIYPDGSVEYTDNDRVSMVEVGTHTSWHCGLATRIVNEKFPIQFPYMPSNKPFRIFCLECLTDPKNGDYDTQAFLYIETPDGAIVNVDRYFKDAKGGMDEISKEEYLERREIANQREAEERDKAKRETEV